MKRSFGIKIPVPSRSNFPFASSMWIFYSESELRHERKAALSGGKRLKH